MPLKTTAGVSPRGASRGTGSRRLARPEAGPSRQRRNAEPRVAHNPGPRDRGSGRQTRQTIGRHPALSRVFTTVGRGFNRPAVSERKKQRCRALAMQSSAAKFAPGKRRGPAFARARAVFNAFRKPGRTGTVRSVPFYKVKYCHTSWDQVILIHYMTGTSTIGMCIRAKPGTTCLFEGLGLPVQPYRPRPAEADTA